MLSKQRVDQIEISCRIKLGITTGEKAPLFYITLNSGRTGIWNQTFQNYFTVGIGS